MLADRDHLKISPWNGLWIRLVDVPVAISVFNANAIPMRGSSIDRIR